MPQILGNFAICQFCDEIYPLSEWDDDWDTHGCPVCKEERGCL